jgi:curved DNA-binding protein CbpA
MNVKDCYRILKVPAGANLEEVKAAFRQQAFRLLPELNRSR